MLCYYMGFKIFARWVGSLLLSLDASTRACGNTSHHAAQPGPCPLPNMTDRTSAPLSHFILLLTDYTLSSFPSKTALGSVLVCKASTIRSAAFGSVVGKS